MEGQHIASGGNPATPTSPDSSEQAEGLFDLDRRQRNVQGLSAGVLVCAATILSFVPVEWFLMRAHFVLLQSLTLVWLASLVGTWVLIRKYPTWALKNVDNVVFGLFLLPE